VTMCDVTDSGASEPLNSELVAWVAERLSGRVRENVPASTITTFAVGGVVRVVTTVESIGELRDVVGQLYREGQSLKVIGNGSNVLVSDAGLSEWIVRLGAGFRSVEKVSGDEFDICGSAGLMSLARKLSDEGYSGLEFAAGIPASFGGAVFMNAGAHGSEIGERIVSVSGILPDGSLRIWQRDELPWRYRSSGLPNGVVVTGARIRLTPGDRFAIAAQCRRNLEHRKATQPLSQPSAGSVFRNPSADNPAGRVLENAGLKGERCGGAMVSELHANWIVNPNREATASDIRSLMQRCRDRARDVCGFVLEPEVKMWGLAALE
jgi:UDP-N-acetylmuramate dehydrogenase